MAGNNIDKVYIQTFEDNVKHLSQQMKSKLRSEILTRSTNGNKHNWEILEFSTAVAKTTSAPATPSLDLGWDRRVSTAVTRHTGTVIDNEDIVQMLIEPKSNAATNLAYSMNRAVDDIIIAQALAAATNGAGASVPFVTGQRIGDGTANISFDLLTQVQEKFMQADVDPAVPKIAVIGPSQVRKLLQLTEQTSRDFAMAPGAEAALQNLNSSGVVPSWMGFKWIMSTRLEVPSANQTDCLFMTADAMGLQVNEDITVQVAQDPSASFAWRIYARLTMGATRIQDRKLVNLRVLDTIT